MAGFGLVVYFVLKLLAGDIRADAHNALTLITQHINDDRLAQAQTQNTLQRTSEQLKSNERLLQLICYNGASNDSIRRRCFDISTDDNGK